MVDIRSTRFQAPCGCVVEYDWDNDLAVGTTRLFKITRIYKTCDKHNAYLQLGQDPFKILV